MEETIKKKNSSTINVKQLTICAMSIALTFVATAFINIKLPIQANGGLIHLGNVVLFTVAVLFGKKIGAIAGGIGMALFDLMGGWLLWAPFTLIIVGVMGFVIGLIMENKKNPVWYVVCTVAALAIKILGYYIAEGVIYGNWIVPIASIPGNIIQVLVGAVLAFMIIGILKRVIR